MTTLNTIFAPIPALDELAHWIAWRHADGTLTEALASVALVDDRAISDDRLDGEGDIVLTGGALGDRRVVAFLDASALVVRLEDARGREIGRTRAYRLA